MISIKNILVPIDFSENSFQALDFGYLLATQNKSTLHLLHTIETVSSLRKYSLMEDGAECMTEECVEEEFGKFLEKLPKDPVQIVKAVNYGKPHEQILLYSRENKVDMIVISTHGWTGITNLLTGSVTNKVLKLSEIPVLCLKASTFSAPHGLFKQKNSQAENWVG
ncbi:MAG: universal stress protein [Ignavibacteriaceae bacterium]|nr:universal stress protein [Ignavibacteriaceae bacterium]